MIVLLDDSWNALMSDDDDGVCWLNLYVMVDELMIIMRCSIMEILRLILYV